MLLEESFVNITFLIGNGFDMNLGLQTGFPAFLNVYLTEGHNNMLTEAIKESTEEWSSLERQLGLFAGDFDGNEDSFFEQKSELEDSLITYLRNMNNKKLTFDNDGVIEFRNKVICFHHCFNPEEQQYYNSIEGNTNAKIDYQFITFNYTSFLDRIYAKAKELGPFSQHVSGNSKFNDAIQPPLHIHGTLDGNDMLLAVNDKSQLGTGKRPISANLERYMVKSVLNNALGNRRIKTAQSIIDNSMYVCIFGMSLGETDLNWWKYLLDWMLQDEKHRLVLFIHSPEMRSCSGFKTIHRQDSEKHRFLKLVDHDDVFDELEKQIIVVFNSDIFTFKNIRVED